MQTPATIKDLLGVEEEPRNARDRLLQTAITLFYQHGFNAIGLDRILTETGVTKTTFYKHFESKEELVVAAIEKRDHWEAQAWRNAMKKIAGDDPRGQLVAVFDVLDTFFNDPSFYGCLFINAAGEFPNPNDPAHKAAALHKKRAKDDFLRLAKLAKIRDPEAFTDVYTTLFEGTLIMRHVHGRNDAARSMRPIVEQLIQQHGA